MRSNSNGRRGSGRARQTSDKARTRTWARNWQELSAYGPTQCDLVRMWLRLQQEREAEEKNLLCCDLCHNSGAEEGGEGPAKKDGEALVYATLLASSLLFAPKHQTGNKLVYFSWRNYAKMRLFFSSCSCSCSCFSSVSFFLLLQLLLLLQVCAQFLFAC